MNIKVRHVKTGEMYDAILLDDREDNSVIFQIVGPRAPAARALVESDNLEVDTLFEPNWEIIRQFH